MGQERSGYNNLSLEVYYPFSTVPVPDLDGDLERAEQLQLDSIFPGGQYATCLFVCYRDPTRNWLFDIGQRLVARNGSRIAWEGVILYFEPFADDQGRGVIVHAMGAWADGLLGATYLRKAWADNRVDPSTWVPQTSAAGEVKCTVNVTAAQIAFVPKSEKWNTAEYAARRYTAPTGQTVKRISYDYDFSEMAMVKPATVFDFDGGSTWTKLDQAFDGNAATSVNVTLTTAHYLWIGMSAGDTDKVFGGSTGTIRFTLGATVNGNASVMSAEYWNGAWTALAISDGTSSGGKTLAQNGDVTFTRPGDWATATAGDATKATHLVIRLKFSANLTANVNLVEIDFGGQEDWYCVVYNVGLASEIAATKISTTGTGSVDNTLATPSQAVEIRFVSNTQQLPWGNGSVNAKFKNLVAYTDSTSPLTASEIVKDWISNVPNLASDTRLVGNNPLVVVPWMTGSGNSLDPETAVDNLARLAALGDATYVPWVAQVLDSESAAARNGQPILSYQPWPALTDYDYLIDVAQAPTGSVHIAQTAIVNDVWVRYTDTTGASIWINKLDDATLADSASQLQYGHYARTLDAGNVSAAVAANLGRRYLASNKDPHYYVTAPIEVTALIYDKNSSPVPASLIQPGLRVRLINWVSDQVGVSGAGLTAIISRVQYLDETEKALLSLSGPPDDLAVILAQYQWFGK